MAEDVLLRLTFAVVLGTLLGIVYSLRLIARIEKHIEKFVEHIDKAVLSKRRSRKKRS